MTERDVLLGYEVGSGDPVRIPRLNLAVTGQTQRSGKTTALEALVHRAGVTSIAFVTKRGERAFADAHRVRPYFRDRADWVFVDQLLSAVLQEKNKYLRQFLIPVCRTTKTLGDVQAAVKRQLATTKREYERGGLTQLDAYLDLIVPDIERATLADTLALKRGPNVMDVVDFSLPMQMLFVQSALEWVREFEERTIVVIPEAWEFVPEAKGSPAKGAAIALARKGSNLGNHIWLDSQDMAGVDKELLRSCPVWLIGVQREANEIKRNLANIPKSVTRPTADAIATLERGQFYACWETHAVKTYVRPMWMTESAARATARGERHPSSRPEDDVATDANLRAENERLLRENTELANRVAQLETRLAGLETAADDPEPDEERPRRAMPRAFDDSETNGVLSEELYRAFLARLAKETPKKLAIALAKPELEIEVTREVIKADGHSLRGKVAQLYAKGFFEAGVTGTAVQREVAKQGKDYGPGNTYTELEKLAEMGFLTKEQGKDDRGRKRTEYRAVPGMKVHVIQARG